VPVAIRAAVACDAGVMHAGVMHALAQRAYSRYVPAIGRRLAPMDDDYAARIRDGQAWAAVDGEQLVGLIVLTAGDDHLLIDNVAVEPERQGTGIGRALLGFAEARALELGLSELRLYANEVMTENRAMYARLGYRETGRGGDSGFKRVYFSKLL
jgi:GNAT superfamily N-acetyltransferase